MTFKDIPTPWGSIAVYAAATIVEELHHNNKVNAIKHVRSLFAVPDMPETYLTLKCSKDFVDLLHPYVKGAIAMGTEPSIDKVREWFKESTFAYVSTYGKPLFLDQRQNLIVWCDHLTEGQIASVLQTLKDMNVIKGVK